MADTPLRERGRRKRRTHVGLSLVVVVVVVVLGWWFNSVAAAASHARRSGFFSRLDGNSSVYLQVVRTELWPRIFRSLIRCFEFTANNRGRSWTLLLINMVFLFVLKCVFVVQVFKSLSFINLYSTVMSIIYVFGSRWLMSS